MHHLPEEREARQPPPITLPKITLSDIDTAARGAAERQAIVRDGRQAWQAIGKAESFENWKRVGAALAVGKAHALEVTHANAAWGRNYSRVFGEWMKRHGFGQMPKSLRSVAIEMHENISAIESWRSTLTEKRRRKLQGPLQNVRRWRRETATGEAKRVDNVKRAEAAWRHFIACMKALSPEQAAPLWQLAHEQAPSFHLAE